MAAERVPQARIAAAQRLGRLIASERGRRLMRSNNYTAGMIVPANCDEAMVDVIDRIEAHGGAPAAIAVHFPDRPEMESMVILHWKGVNYDAPENSSEGVKLRNSRAGEGSTVGMVADTLDGRRISVDVQKFMKEISPSLSAFA